MNNQRGSTMILALSILVIIMLGLWSLSSFINQEHLTFDKYKKYVVTEYAKESIQEAFIYKVNSILSIKTWNSAGYVPGSEMLLDGDDTDDIEAFLTVLDAAGLNSNEIDILNGTPLWYNSDCINVLSPILDFSTNINICAKLEFSVNNKLASVWIKIDDIAFIDDGTIAPVGGHSDTEISDID